MHAPANGPRTSAPSASNIPTNTPSYTPGPWREHSHRQIGPDVGIVCEVWSAIGWGDAAIREADANVHLIAAAPELHQALKTLIADYRIGMAVVRPRTMTLIRAALAKAEGGAA